MYFHDGNISDDFGLSDCIIISDNDIDYVDSFKEYKMNDLPYMNIRIDGRFLGKVLGVVKARILIHNIAYVLGAKYHVEAFVTAANEFCSFEENTCDYMNGNQIDLVPADPSLWDELDDLLSASTNHFY